MKYHIYLRPAFEDKREFLGFMPRSLKDVRAILSEAGFRESTLCPAHYSPILGKILNIRVQFWRRSDNTFAYAEVI